MRYLINPVKGDASTNHGLIHPAAAGAVNRLPIRSLKSWKLIPIAVAVIGPAIITAACGDGGGGTPDAVTPTAIATATTTATTAAATPTPTTTATPSATPTAVPFQSLLEQMVLQAEDVPAELLLVSAITTTNEDLASNHQNPEDELARLEASGRLLGHRVDYVPDSLPETGLSALSSEARLFQTSDGAIDDFLDDVQELRNANWVPAYPELTDLEVREIERPDLADQVIWIRISGLQDAEEGTLSMEDFVVLRRDRVWAFLRVQSRAEPFAGPDSLLENIAGLANRQIQRIDAALKDG
jgi:hypothetical protein